MSKKHFIALAHYLEDNALDNWTSVPESARESLREHLANFCHSVNPRFNRERWLDYIAGKCGPNGGAIRD